MPTRSTRGRFPWARHLAAIGRVVLAACVVGGALLAAPVPSAAQATPSPVAFDDAGRLREITPGIADRLGLRPPTWPVEGEYRRARLLRSDAGWTLEVERFDNRVDRATLTDEQVGAIRLEVSARAEALQRATGRPVEPPPLTTTAPSAAPRPAGAAGGTATGAAFGPTAGEPISRRDFVWRETLLGAGFFGPLAWAAVDSRAFSPSAYLFTAAGTFLLATNAINRAPYTKPQTTIGTLAALGGAAGGAALAYALADASPRAQAITALTTGVGLHVGALWWADRAGPADAAGVLYGGLGGALLGVGGLGAAGVLDRPDRGDRRAIAGVLAATTMIGAPLGRAYTTRRDVRVTDGDVGAVALAGGLGAVLGLGVAGGTTAAEGPKYLWPTLLGAAGAVAGDRLLAVPFDHEAGDVGTLAVGAVAGAAIAMLPYWLAGDSNERTLLLLGGVGGIAGLWGGEVVTRPRPGRRVGTAPTRPRVRVDAPALLFAALRQPGIFPVVRVTF